MKRAVTLLLSLGLVLGLSVAIVRHLARAAPAGPVYTVAQVTAGLAVHPRA